MAWPFHVLSSVCVFVCECAKQDTWNQRMSLWHSTSFGYFCFREKKTSALSLEEASLLKRQRTNFLFFRDVVEKEESLELAPWNSNISPQILQKIHLIFFFYFRKEKARTTNVASILMLFISICEAGWLCMATLFWLSWSMFHQPIASWSFRGPFPHLRMLPIPVR